MAEVARTARLDVLVEGYVRFPNVAGTVSLIRDEDRVVIVDPGMVADRELILHPLRELGVQPEDVTDVVLSHHHLDRTLPRGPGARLPVRHRGRRVHAAGGGRHSVTPSIQLLATPGHTPQDITTLVGTADDVAALTHLWWTDEGPAEDPYSTDREQLRQQRERVLDLATLIVPGHGAPFRPGATTPR